MGNSFDSYRQTSGGSKPPKVLVNGANGMTPFFMLAPGSGAKDVVTGVLIANTLSTVLSITGSGVVNFLTAQSVDTTARTHRLKITIDGVVVSDNTSASVAAVNKGIAAIGLIGLSAGGPVIDQIPFNSSFLAEYASSVTETGKTIISYVYRTN
jgi:hypothetical protein